VFPKLRVLLVISFLLFCMVGVARALDNGFAQVNVNVYNDANLPRETLVRAEDKAGIVLRRAGVHVEWVNLGHEGGVPGSSKPPQDYGCCSPGNFSIRIVPHSLTLADRTFGVSFLGADGYGRYSDIFYATADQLSRSAHVSLPDVLGHVIAHELGHLLLGTNAHSATGIMRPHWSTPELQSLAMGRLLFTPQQSQTMQAGLRTQLESAHVGQSNNGNLVARKTVVGRPASPIIGVYRPSALGVHP
jgi:hypothetical protein